MSGLGEHPAHEPDGAREASGHQRPDPRAKGAASGEPDERRYLAGRLGRSVGRFDGALSERVARGAGQGIQRLADLAKSRVQSGMWQDYAFLVIAAVVALTVVVLVARGCVGVGGP